jgi:hypothetical protein
MRENRTSGSVAGYRSDPVSYADCAISPQRALALGAAHRAQQEEPKTECRRKKYEIRRMGQKQSYSFQVESP